MMNFFPNIPLVPSNPQLANYLEQMDKIFSKINEFDIRIKKLEEKINNIENNDNYSEPDDSFYMI